MKRNAVVVLLVSHLFLSAVVSAQSQTPIDFDKARSLLRRANSGSTLTAEEQAYLDRAKKLRSERQRGAQNSSQRKPPERLIPLSDMGAKASYDGEEGGLYGAGSNTPPKPLLKAAQAATAMIKPLDVDGKASADGTIGFVSISMSNATQEFSFFKRLADALPEKSSNVTIVDCAQGGQAMAQWVPNDGRPWQVANRRLAAAGVDPKQVQVAWVKLANVSPRGSLKEHGRKLESDTIKVLRNAKALFPNLRVAYLGSRIWAGNATGGLNPEPYAYESAFVVRWLIQRQMGGDTELSADRAPLLLWGPYLWAEGERGRKIDSLEWMRDDFAGDGVHPSTSGREKVAKQLLRFVTSDELAKTWFLAKQVN
jgi:hypothetical protein